MMVRRRNTGVRGVKNVICPKGVGSIVAVVDCQKPVYNRDELLAQGWAGVGNIKKEEDESIFRFGKRGHGGRQWIERLKAGVGGSVRQSIGRIADVSRRETAGCVGMRCP